MKLLINGEKKEVSETRRLTELLKELNYEGQNFAVAINRQFIPRAEYEKTSLQDSDEIEILMPLQGG